MKGADQASFPLKLNLSLPIVNHKSQLKANEENDLAAYTLAFDLHDERHRLCS